MSACKCAAACISEVSEVVKPRWQHCIVQTYSSTDKRRHAQKAAGAVIRSSSSTNVAGCQHAAEWHAQSTRGHTALNDKTAKQQRNCECIVIKHGPDIV